MSAQTDRERFLYRTAPRSDDDSQVELGPTIAVREDVEMRSEDKGWIRNARERNWCIAFTVAALLAFALIIALIAKPARQGDSTAGMSLCQSPECVELSASMRTAMNQEADPCEDFYEFACGSWAKQNPRPAARPRWSNFDVLSEKNQETVKSLLEKVIDDLPATLPDPITDPFQKAAVYYRACLEAERATDAVGIDQIRDDVLGSEITWTPADDNVWSAADRTSLAQVLARVHFSDAAPFFSSGVGADDKNSSLNIFQIFQSGLGLPDKGYYTKPADTDRTLLAYKKLISEQWKLAFPDDEAQADAIAAEILAFETRLAGVTIDRSELRDPVATYKKLSRSELEARWTSEMFDWAAYFTELFPFTFDLKELLCRTGDYFDKVFPIIGQTPQSTVMHYIKWQRLSSYTGHLSKPFRDNNFEFSRVLSGVDSEPPRWETCMARTDNLYGFVLGNLFVNETFRGSSRSTAMEMIADVRSSFKEALPSLSWMDDATRNLAADKADAVIPKIGFPEFSINPQQLSDYYKDVTSSLNYLDNIRAARAWDSKRGLENIKKPVDRTEWGMSPPTVNAYYSPTNNEIVFPAGIMQRPFFAATNLKAVNYGGIGVVMGHELTHGFDDQGANYDKTGNLRQWWSPDVVNNFGERTACVANKYSEYSVKGPDGTQIPVDGNLTNGENIADNGGLKQAIIAYRKWVSRNGEEDRLVGLSQYTPEQLFYLSFAQVWCAVVTPESAEISVRTDPHSPPQVRVLGTLSNSPAFAEAWNCPANSPMNPSTKCEVW